MDDKLRNIEVEKKFISVQKKVTMDDTIEIYKKNKYKKYDEKRKRKRERKKASMRRQSSK